MTANENGTGRERLNLHIFLADLLHVNRLFKEAAFTRRRGVFERVVVVGLWSRGLELREVTGYGLEIRRVKVLIRRLATASPLRRILPVRKLIAAFSMLEFAAKAIRQALELRPTHVSCHNVVLLPVCWIAARVTGAHLVYLPHELEPQRAHLHGLAQKAQVLIERAFVRSATEVVVVCEPIARWYRQTYGLTNVHVVRNVPERDAVVIKPVPEGDFRQRFAIPAGATVFIYQGIFGKARGTDRLLEIFAGLSPERAHIVFMGFGEPADQEVIDRYVAGHSNIHYQPAVPRELITSHTSGADIGIFIAKDPPLNDRWALPNKFFEFTHSGLPVLVSDNLEYLSEIVAEHDIGWSAPYGEIQRKIEALAEIDVEPYRPRARAYASSAVWEEDARVFETVYGHAGAIERSAAPGADQT